MVTLHPLAELTKPQMTPRNEQSADPSAGKDFFTNVSREGYPSYKARAQPWKNIWAGAQGKDTQPDDKMVVACALRHDYGTQSHLYNRISNIDNLKVQVV